MVKYDRIVPGNRTDVGLSYAVCVIEIVVTLYVFLNSIGCNG